MFLLVISTCWEVVPQMVNPGRGGRGCLGAKCSRQFVSWLIFFIGNGIIGHLNLVSGGTSDGGGGGVVHLRPNAAKHLT